MLILKLILILIAAFFICAAIQGIIRANRMTPEEQAAFLQDYKAKKKAQKIYQKRYDYWYDKSYDVIDGCAAQSARERDAYARRHALQDIKKYNWE